jgi:hypothetical protein
MFWRKRKPQIDAQIPAPVNHLAGQLGVERRYAVRILYPQNYCTLLPTVYFNGSSLKVHDISVGGCCLLDPGEVLGASVGNDVHLVLRWKDGGISVHGRIVSRVDHNRHIQFSNLPKARAEELKIAISFGTRAQTVRSSMETVEQGPALQAREIWSSVHGDSVIIEDHIHRLAQITISGALYTLYKHAWPVKAVSTPLTRDELAGLIVFLCNIPQPTELLSALVAHVETMAPLTDGGAP